MQLRFIIGNVYTVIADFDKYLFELWRGPFPKYLFSVFVKILLACIWNSWHSYIITSFIHFCIPRNVCFHITGLEYIYSCGCIISPVDYPQAEKYLLSLSCFPAKSIPHWEQSLDWPFPSSSFLDRILSLIDKVISNSLIIWAAYFFSSFLNLLWKFVLLNKVKSRLYEKFPSSCISV